MAASTFATKDEKAREATPADFQAVLDIEPHGYLGLDYLPTTYSSLVEGPGVKGYVYEKNEAVAGFLSTQLVDDGQTVVTSAGRVHPRHRGGGMYGRFKRQVFGKLADCPHLKHLAFAVSNVGLEGFGEKLLKTYSIVMDKNLTGMEMQTDDLRSVLSTNTISSARELHVMSRHDVTTMLRLPPSNLLHLFPQQRILLDWHPYRITEGNADVIFNPNNRVFVANAEELASVSSKGSNYPITLISCGSHFACERGRNYDVDIFGSGSDADVRMHVEWHLRRLSEVGQEKVGVMKVFDRRSLDDVVSDLKTEYPLQPVMLPYQKVFVLEAEFENVCSPKQREAVNCN